MLRSKAKEKQKQRWATRGIAKEMNGGAQHSKGNARLRLAKEKQKQRWATRGIAKERSGAEKQRKGTAQLRIAEIAKAIL